MRVIKKTGTRHGIPYDLEFKFDDDAFERIKDLANHVVWSGSNPYLDIMIGKDWHKAHRLVVIGLIPHEKNLTADHIDRNTLNNQRSNLRIVTQQQQCFNRTKRSDEGLTSKHKGVSKNSQGYWRAGIDADKHYHLGTYKTEDEAGMAYNLKAIELFGDKAVLNDVPAGIVPIKHSKGDGTKATHRKGKPTSSQYLGVSYRKDKNKWEARWKGKRLGLHATEILAKEAIDKHKKESFKLSCLAGRPSSCLSLSLPTFGAC